jgi:hypothetical protein
MVGGAGGEQLRVVGAGGAGAHQDGVVGAAATPAERERERGRDPAGIAAAGGDAAVEGHRPLAGDARPAGGHPRQEAAMEVAGALTAAADLVGDAGRAQQRGGRVLVRIAHRRHHPRHPRRNQGVGAGRLAALAGAGREGDIGGGPGGIVAARAAVGQSGGLGVQAAAADMAALAEQPAGAYQHAADSGIGPGHAQAERGQAQGAVHPGLISVRHQLRGCARSGCALRRAALRLDFL